MAAPPPPNLVAVLEEEDYVDAIEDIIKRDYFPDPKGYDDDSSTIATQTTNTDNTDTTITASHYGGPGKPPTLTLSEFHKTHTSEDNEYYRQQQIKSLEEHRRLYAYAYGDKPLMLLPDGTEATKER